MSRLHRKDYAALARIFAKLQSRQDPHASADAEDMRCVIAHDIANLLQSKNPSFDKLRFLAACAAM